MLCLVKSHFLKILHVDDANDVRYRAPHSHAICLLEKPIMCLKICGFQTNPQQFNDGSVLQGRPFCQCAIVMEFITDDL
jgi:hypothetical protein